MDYKSTSLLKYNCLLVLINFHGLIISSLGQEISPINTTGYLSLTNSADSNINLMNTTTAVTPTVPPMPDDLFKFLHNYSSPNAAVCFKMFLDYYKVWSLTFSDRYCFCNGFPTCDPTRYNITKDHQKYLDWFLDVQWERNKRTRVKLAAEDAFRDFIEFKSILIALYSLVWIWGISGNAIVILTILRFMNKSNVTNIFILNLSVSDMVVTAFCLPFRAMVKVGRIWYFGNWMCKGVIWVFYGSFMVSSFTMTAMAMERYLVICHPMKAQYISTPGRAKKIITVVWIASIGLSALPAYFVTGETDTYSCQLRLHPALDEGGKHEYVTSSVLYYTFSVAFILPLLVMIFAYTRTGITLYRSVKEARALTGNTSSTKQSQDKDKKEDDLKTRIQVVRMLVVVLAVFVIAWLPHTLMEIIRYHHKFVPTSVKEQRDAALWVWWNNLENNINSGFILLTFVNSCLNPVFYAFLSRSFKKGFAKLFACCPCCKNAAKRRQLEASTSISSGLTASTSGLSTSG